MDAGAAELLTPLPWSETLRSKPHSISNPKASTLSDSSLSFPAVEAPATRVSSLEQDISSIAHPEFSIRALEVHDGGGEIKVMGRKMEWAAGRKHLGGVPRKLVFMAVGAFAKAVANLLNTSSVHNADTLIGLVRSRPPGVPLITVSNHMSTLDDPLMWGFKGFPSFNSKLARWVLAAEDICFRNSVMSYFFRLGKCIPITRGGGIYQEHMNEALDRLNEGAWLHTFPEGKISQEDGPLRRLKWGTASLIARAPVTPIVLPIVHHGFQELMPENFRNGRRPPFPLSNKHIKIIIGEPIEFDLPKMREMAISMTRNLTFPSRGWPNSNPHGLDEAAQSCLYMNISEKIQTVLESLRSYDKNS